MKIGIRKPSIKKSISARTTGALKREVKKAVNPLYGQKGMGMITDPKKALYNKVYNKTTVGFNLNIRTKSGKEIEDYENITDFLSEIDLDTISLSDIDEMSIEALEIIYKSNEKKKLNKEDKKKMERISSKIILLDLVPCNIVLGDNVKTKSGKSRHDFPSDFRYLADLDLSTFTENDIDRMDSETITAIYQAKNTSWKRKEEKAIYKKIEQRYIEENIL